MGFNFDVSDSLEELEKISGEKITYAGNDYPCIASSRSLGASLDIDGFALQSDISVTLRSSLFSTTPTHGQTFVHKAFDSDGTTVLASKTYRITEVRKAVGSSFFRLIGVDPNRGA